MPDIVQEILIRIIACTVGVTGFAVLYYIEPKKLPIAAIGSALTISIYLVLYELVFVGGGEFFPNLIAALTGAIYCEVMARVTKTPAPVYLTPAMFSLAPGRLLYNTMSYMVNASYEQAGAYALLTLQAALGIAGGIIGASVVGIFLRTAATRVAHRRAAHASKRKEP